MPVNRGIVCRGVYRVMRHPIYAGYLVTHAAFLAAHPTGWNLLLVLLASDTALLVRATYEERTLMRSRIRNLHDDGALASAVRSLLIVRHRSRRPPVRR